MTEYRVTTDLDSLPFCTIHEMSVTVTVVDNEVEVTYHLDRVKHFGVESEYDPYRPISKLDRKVELPDPPPRISFSMKPVAADDGTYMTVTKKKNKNQTVSNGISMQTYQCILVTILKCRKMMYMRQIHVRY